MSHRSDVTTIGFAHGTGGAYSYSNRHPNGEPSIESIQRNRERFIYSDKQYAVQDPVDGMPDSRVKSELHRMGINTANQSASARRQQLRLAASDHPTNQTTRVPPGLSSSAMTGAVAYGNSKAHLDEKSFTSEGFTIVDDRYDELHPDVPKLQHELRVLQATNLELNQENFKLSEKKSEISAMESEIARLRKEKSALMDDAGKEKAELYEQLEKASKSGGGSAGLQAQISELKHDIADLKTARDISNSEKAEWMAKAADEQSKKRISHENLTSVTAELDNEQNENARLRAKLDEEKAAYAALEAAGSRAAPQPQPTPDREFMTTSNAEKARLQQQITSLESENAALRASAATASTSDADAAEKARLNQEIVALESKMHQLESAAQANASAPAPVPAANDPIGEHMQADLRTLGLDAQGFKFGKRVFQCMIPHPGVGYRNTPSFPDKVPDGTGPEAPQCIVADAMVQGPKAVFVRCVTGRGWLPLTDPNGSRICFKHLGETDDVDLSKHGLELADGSVKFSSPKKKVDWYK
jgi:hypothetical protein